ncbi:MAG: RidA family protein [Terrimesophilobacter sp.]
MEKTRIMPKDMWDWPVPTPFSQGWKVSGDYDTIFVGGQISVDEQNNVIGKGDIEVQTRNVFENISKVLRDAGAEITDVVKFNTFYTFDGSGAEVQEFWEKMTRVRLEFFREPGPCGTAVRCSGFMLDDILIEVEAIAVIPKRQ